MSSLLKDAFKFRERREAWTKKIFLVGILVAFVIGLVTGLLVTLLLLWIKIN